MEPENLGGFIVEVYRYRDSGNKSLTKVDREEYKKEYHELMSFRNGGQGPKGAIIAAQRVDERSFDKVGITHRVGSVF